MKLTVWPSLKGYLTEAYDLGTEPAETITAVLADIRHLCDELGVDYDVAAYEAMGLYYARDAAQWYR